MYRPPINQISLCHAVCRSLRVLPPYITHTHTLLILDNLFVLYSDLVLFVCFVRKSCSMAYLRSIGYLPHYISYTILLSALERVASFQFDRWRIVGTISSQTSYSMRMYCFAKRQATALLRAIKSLRARSSYLICPLAWSRVLRHWLWERGSASRTLQVVSFALRSSGTPHYC